MVLKTPDTTGGAAENVLSETAEHYQEVLTQFREATAKIRDEGGVPSAQTEKTLHLFAKATTLLFTEKKKIEDSIKSEDGVVHHYALDLDTAFEGNGLRPYSPAHLKADVDVSGDTNLSWVRRTRVDGDNWSSLEVPLGEDVEQYLVSVIDGGTVVCQTTVSSPIWTYSAAARAADGVSSPYSIHVAQVSARFGPGVFKRINL